MSAKSDYEKKTNTKENFIKEVFENYGYIDLDTVDPSDKNFRSFLKKNFIKTKKLGPGGGGWDEYRYTGVYSLLLKMLEKDPTLSTIQRTGVTKKSNQLFGEVARQVTKAKSTGSSSVGGANSKSWFL
jgi:hypothetical protein